MMRLRSFLLLGSLLLPVPLLAQPTGQPVGRRDGPWAADADGDGRITRAEMRAWMEQRFKLMDPDGDGLVPVEAMQRMLGHDPQDGDRASAQGGRKHGAGKGGFGGHHGGPGEGGPPPGDRSSGGKRGDGPPPGPPGAVMPYPEDSNDDGKIDLQEFVAPAMAMFDQFDANGDGVLTADELPPPPPRQGEGERPEE